MSTITGNPLLIAAQLAQGQGRRDRDAAIYGQAQAQGAPVQRAGDDAARITLSRAAQAMAQAQQPSATPAAVKAAPAAEAAALQPAYRAAAGQREAPLAALPKPAFQRPGSTLDIVI